MTKEEYQAYCIAGLITGLILTSVVVIVLGLIYKYKYNERVK